CGQIRRVLQFVVQQVHDDFGVGIGGEQVAKAFETITQRLMVFDDAVVDNGQFAAGKVWVRVVFQRRTLIDLADAAATLQHAGIAEQRDTGTVVTAVFQTLEAFQQDGGDITFSDSADNSTHVFFS
nr:hypothetical protein [Tanacetum cinerariifolium]